jgi:hypothetical protein
MATKVTARRGASDRAPENTLAAIVFCDDGEGKPARYLGGEDDAAAQARSAGVMNGSRRLGKRPEREMKRRLAKA